ncbi:MAG: HlyD family efflux transporter periplasmic adaptor subunit [Planctomycetaceae bacterium]|nr:HlyD family efflux transporter periplasmic adaptor subunit [Planctomycetaceae bacterium]
MLVALTGFVVAVVYAFMPRPVPVDLALVTEGPLEIAVEEDGKTRLRDRYTVSAPLGGRLMRLRFKAGDIVPRSQPVAAIEPADPALLDARTLAQTEARVKAARSALERAGTALESAKAGLDLAEAEYARAAELLQKNALSKSELDLKVMQRRTKLEDYRAARHSENVSRFELELSQAALLRTRPSRTDLDDNSYFEIPAPPLADTLRAFHVLRVFQESEAVVAPGAPLLELGDPSDIEVEIDVLSSDAVKIRRGARVLLEQWGGDEPLEARVRLVEPSGFTKISALGVEEQRVFVIADFPRPEAIPAALGDGYRVEARIITWESPNVLRVPTSALFREGDEWAVFRVVAGKAAKCPVKVGHRNGLSAEVLDGLAAHDTVVVHPSDKVVDGALVKAR